MLDLKRLSYLVFGLCFGGGLIWILLREVSIDAAGEALAMVDYRFLLVALAAYAVAIALRTLRWRSLLASIAPAPYRKVLLVLIIGYAVNGLLPARLGEIVRADLARSKLDISRSTALGTIAVERIADGLSVVAMLGIGLMALPVGAQYGATLRYVLAAAAALFGLAAFLFYLLSGSWQGASRKTFAPLAIRFSKFRDGLRILRSPRIIGASLLTFPVWAADATSVWFVLRSVHVALLPMQLLMTVGLVSLSTLLPSAPGYLGTYQLAFVMALSSFGFASAKGFAAATVSQTFILGTHYVIGIGLMLINHVRLSGLLVPATKSD